MRVDPSQHAGHRAALLRSGARRRATGLLLVTFAAVGASACSSTTPAEPTSAQVVSSLGAVPVPMAPAAEPVVVASAGHGQLVAMGAPVDLRLPDGSKAMVTATGPRQSSTAPQVDPRATIIGTISLQVQATKGTVTVSAADLTSRDDTGQLIALRTVGLATVTVRAGTTATITVDGRFRSGAAQLTLSNQGHRLALWDFSIELD